MAVIVSLLDEDVETLTGILNIFELFYSKNNGQRTLSRKGMAILKKIKNAQIRDANREKLRSPRIPMAKYYSDKSINIHNLPYGKVKDLIKDNPEANPKDILK